jgi:hypothetical protein
VTYMPCICGHALGEHRSAGTSFPHPPRYGVCLAPDCGCREYVDAEQRNSELDDARAAAEDDPRRDLMA